MNQCAMQLEGIRHIGDGLLEVGEERLKEFLVEGSINDLYDVEQTPFARYVRRRNDVNNFMCLCCTILSARANLWPYKNTVNLKHSSSAPFPWPKLPGCHLRDKASAGNRADSWNTVFCGGLVDNHATIGCSNMCAYGRLLKFVVRSSHLWIAILFITLLVTSPPLLQRSSLGHRNYSFIVDDSRVCLAEQPNYQQFWRAPRTMGSLWGRVIRLFLDLHRRVRRLGICGVVSILTLRFYRILHPLTHQPGVQPNARAWKILCIISRRHAIRVGFLRKNNKKLCSCGLSISLGVQL